MTDYDEIRKHVEANSQTYLNSLKEACSIPSVSTEGTGFKEMADWLEQRLGGLGATVSRLSVDGSPEALLGVIPGSGDRTLMIYDHYDVQPVDPIDLWESPPFEPTERDGRMFARGAADNKGDLVARISALGIYKELVGDLPFTIKFFIEGEEESGSVHFEKICQKYASELASDDCVWEGGWFDLDGAPQMYFGCKGLLYIELNARKLSGDQHSSIAVYAPSAAWQLLRAVASIKDSDDSIIIEGFHDGVSEPTPEEVALVDKIPFNESATLESLGAESFLGGLTGTELKRNMIFTPTANIAGFHSGYGVPGASKTVLPAEAMAKLDFRLVPDQDAEDIAKKLMSHLERNGFGDVEVRVLSAQNPSRSPIDTKLGLAARNSAQKWFPKETAVFPQMWATGPMYPIAQGLGIPICSPPGVGRPDSNLHAPNEHCRIPDYLSIVGYTVAYLEEYGRA
ncbi:MAG TPA: M20/M25/M40 family metallo-hydrolase [Actinomycetota bacterium]|nr:M20/M25/M40 family metallo-hydrolase [Actinomycetota bacterium]